MAWEPKFDRWSKPPGKTEQERCENAESMIRNAIANSEKLKNRDTLVFTQGSYRNRVNVSKDSDVDIGVLCRDTFFYMFPPEDQLPVNERESYSSLRAYFDITPATYQFSEFKDEVGEALVDYFGPGVVTRGNKAYDIKSNSYHVEADVAPFFQHRRFDASKKFIEGVELLPDNAPTQRIINWPEQHYSNGVSKNQRTSRRYKGVVRILKSLRAEMQQRAISQAEVLGFLIECLVWNVTDQHLAYSDWTTCVRESLAFLWNKTRSDDECSEWGEVSDLKYLFATGQPWTRQQAHDFVDAAWKYLEFE